MQHEPHPSLVLTSTTYKRIIDHPSSTWIRLIFTPCFQNRVTFLKCFFLLLLLKIWDLFQMELDSLISWNRPRIIRGWAKKLIGWLWCNDRIVIYFSPAVHTLLPSVLQRLDSRGILDDLILIFEKVLNCRCDLISGPILIPSQVFFFSCWGTENSQMVPTSGECGGWSTSSKPQSRTAAIATTDLCAEHCPGKTRPPSSVFQTVHKMSLLLLFNVPNYLSTAGLSSVVAMSGKLRASFKVVKNNLC